MSRLIVHTGPGSPYGRAVLAAIAEKGEQWELSPLMGGTHLGEAHLARHPFGKMPALEVEGSYFYETQAILRYLDETLPGPSLTPDTAEGRYRMNVLIGICDAYLFAEAGRVVVFQRVVGPAFVPGFVPDEAAIAAAMPISHKVFAELSRILGDDPWLAGTTFTLADLMIGPHLELFRRTPEWAELTAERPNLAEYLERIEARPSMQGTLWERLMELVAAQAA